MVVAYFVAYRLGRLLMIDPVSRTEWFTKKARHERYAPGLGNSLKILQGAV
jgi:hypothetical protein